MRHLHRICLQLKTESRLPIIRSQLSFDSDLVPACQEPFHTVGLDADDEVQKLRQVDNAFVKGINDTGRLASGSDLQAFPLKYPTRQPTHLCRTAISRRRYTSEYGRRDVVAGGQGGR